MKKLFVSLSQQLLRVLPALALMIATASVSATCFYMSHQPDVPEGLEEYEE